LTVLASVGVVLAAAYILWMVQRVLYGKVSNEKNRSLPDLSPRELGVILPLVALAIFMGVASPLFTRKIEPSMSALVRQVQSRAGSSRGVWVATLPAAPDADRGSR